MPLITVRLGSRSSAVHVGRPLADLGPLCAQTSPGRRVLLVTDTAVGRLYAAAARRSLETAGRSVRVVAVPPGESSKTLERARALLGECSRFGLERRDAVVALGGGVVSDLAGFAASVYLRGVAFVVAPTTLLAQVDASVGGKNGVNLPWGKNLVGTFHQPSFVLIDLAVLDSLPEREMRQGYAEIVKCGVIRSPRVFSVFENPPAGGPRAELPFLVEECIRIKAAVVSRDERETRTLSRASAATASCCTARRSPSAWFVPRVWPGI